MRAAPWVVFAALAAVPAVLLVDLGFAYARGWRPTSDLAAGIAAACALLLVLAVLAVATARGRAIARRGWAGIALASAVTVAAWGGAEVIAAATMGGHLLFHRDVGHAVRSFAPRSDVVLGVRDPAVRSTNSLGIRGPELPAPGEAYSILCVGGSTTACLYLDDAEAWPELLRRELIERGQRVWVGDVGQSGYASAQHLQLLEDGDLVQRFDCLLFLVGVNDFTLSLRGRRLAAPFGVHPLWERSSIYALLQNAYHAHRQRRRHMEESPDGSQYIARRAKRAQATACAELPDLTAGLADYQANLRQIIARCRELRVRCVFLTQPVLWTGSLDSDARARLWFGELPDGRFLTAGALAAGMAQFNAALRATCAAEGAECIDLSAMDGDAALFYDDCHFTEAGATRVALLVAAALPLRPR